jgi:lysophospholipase L1-like esterase
MKQALLSTIFYFVFLVGCLQAEPVRILAIGDSITQGGKTFVTYRLPLDQKLRAAGLNFEFVGSQQSEGPNGPLRHEGYGGKNAEFLAGIIPQKLRQLNPDVILLHCGHNHSAEEKPVSGILSAERTIIEAARKQNPKVVVLLAQVITSGKLPKYSYIPELNQAQVLLARELSRPDAPVVLVDQATGFDPQKDTISDKVHPNVQGAEKMADKWFLALKRWVNSSGALGIRPKD